MNKLLVRIIMPALWLLVQFVSLAGNSKIDSLMTLVPGKEGTALADLYLEVSEVYSYTNPLKSIEFAERALAVVDTVANLEQTCYSYLLIGNGYINVGEFQKAKPYIDRGLERAEGLGDAKYISVGKSALAAFYMNVGNYDQALDLFQETLQTAIANKMEDREARARLNIGAIYTTTGERAEGLRYMTEALRYFESVGNRTISSRILNNIAVNYHSWKDYDLALKYYRRTLRTYEAESNYLGKVMVLNNIGEIYKDQGHYEMALKYYDQIFDLADQHEVSAFYMAVAKVGMADTYLKLDERAKAKQYAEECLKVFKQANMQEGIVHAQLVLAELDFKEGRLNKALQQTKSSLDLAEAMGIQDLVQEIYLLMSQILEAQNRYQESLKSYRHFMAISDSLIRERQHHQLALHRAEVNISEKESEIELLQKDNEIKDLQLIRQKTQSRTLIIAVGLLIVVIALSLSYNKARTRSNILLQEKNKQITDQHEELLRVNQTKDKFLSIIGHDLRNPIGAFKDMVSQLAEFPEMFNEELRNQILEELRDEAESTYFLLDNLLLWAKTQKNNIQFKPEKLKLNLVIKNNIILNTRIAARKKITLKSAISDDVLVNADHNMIDLVVRNLLSNAIKFTPEEGKVNILVKDESPDFVEVSIKDNGVGISEKDLPRLLDPNDHLSTYGTGNEKGSGLGLVLCREFIEMNGGKLEIQSRVGRGSTFSFTLKKYRAEQA
ncbi:tetratricopeptide repeat protein [Sunxiuqinia elliptica]|uniref:histidine kinase n=1 Tax=Sunxiuqinia elliptica TaxID=655355 RepID=A0A4R6H5V1_9BACT|nr:tetratricopeptide repeat protein [Sunxiuqinia elliptica]TDO03158.1 tetratricopeptide repeat protein [Sunxiuqinia elliptica]TDO59355.1 tetratricopeptide repeat protein [Sunxiuqinia elliptica]